MVTVNQEVIDRLIKTAKESAWCDNEEFMVDDYAAGNIDDAYYGGCTDGEILLARQILTMLGVDYVS